MVNFESLFLQSKGQKIEYNSKDLVLMDRIAVPGACTIKIMFEAVNSDWRQAVVLNTKGTFLVAGQTIRNSVILWEDTAPNEVTIEVITKSKELVIYNAWDVGNGTTHYWHNGAAMWIEALGATKRYHCNDGYPDDDLNDLIFTLSVDSLT